MRFLTRSTIIILIAGLDRHWFRCHHQAYLSKCRLRGMHLNPDSLLLLFLNLLKPCILLTSPLGIMAVIATMTGDHGCINLQPWNHVTLSSLHGALWDVALLLNGRIFGTGDLQIDRNLVIVYDLVAFDPGVWILTVEFCKTSFILEHIWALWRLKLANFKVGSCIFACSLYLVFYFVHF